MGMTFTGQVAVVTGGGAGIGRAAALAFAGEGLKVVVADRDVAAGEDTVEQIRAAGGSAVFAGCDVTVEAQVRQLMEQTISTYGRLDYAFNNAGIEIEHGRLADGTLDEFDAIMGVNVKGVWLCMKYQLPLMLAQGGGAIVNISTYAVFEPEPTFPVSGTLRAALAAFTKLYADQYAPKGIRMNNVLPGFIDSLGETPERRQRIPMGRYGTVAEIAKTVRFLLSSDAGYITGQNLRVDGGITRSV